jgi:hypothetical protein
MPHFAVSGNLLGTDPALFFYSDMYLGTLSTRYNHNAAPNWMIPMRRPCLFKERDVTRAAKAIRAAGLDIERVEITKDGAIIIFPGKPEQVAGEGGKADNEWDSIR